MCVLVLFLCLYILGVLMCCYDFPAVLFVLILSDVFLLFSVSSMCSCSLSLCLLHFCVLACQVLFCYSLFVLCVIVVLLCMCLFLLYPVFLSVCVCVFYVVFSRLPKLVLVDAPRVVMDASLSNMPEARAF